MTQTQKLEWLKDNIILEEYTLEDIISEIKTDAFCNKKANKTDALAEYLKGLPSWNSFPYYDDDILQLKKEWGYKTDDDKFLANYWNALANLVMQYFKKQKIYL